MDQEEREEVAVNMTKTLWMLYEAACHRQIGPDGKDCALCGEKNHQAFECRYNAFVRFDALRRTAAKLCAVHGHSGQKTSSGRGRSKTSSGSGRSKTTRIPGARDHANPRRPEQT